MDDFILTFVTIIEQIFSWTRASILGFWRTKWRHTGGVAATATAALLDRRSLGIYASSTAAAVVSRERGSSAIWYIQRLQEEHQ